MTNSFGIFTSLKSRLLRPRYEMATTIVGDVEALRRIVEPPPPIYAGDDAGRL
jgi:hypothetical protein